MTTWQWESISPGMTVLPRQSTVMSADEVSISVDLPTATMIPSRARIVSASMIGCSSLPVASSPILMIAVIDMRVSEADLSPFPLPCRGGGACPDGRVPWVLPPLWQERGAGG